MEVGLWLQSGLAIVLVVTAGSALSQNADMLAVKTQLGHSWVGGFLLAGATSLPEFATGMSAVTVPNAPDLVAGSILGSCLFNLVILALLDIFCGPDPLFQRAHVSHSLAAGLGCVLLGITGQGLFSVISSQV
jgi:cation:H+ antiporter